VGEFWDLTPREAGQVIVAMRERERDSMLTLAWHVAALERVKRLPTLAYLLRPPSSAAQVPIEERRNEFNEMRKAWQARQS
jgi:hypothetical protein